MLTTLRGWNEKQAIAPDATTDAPPVDSATDDTAPDTTILTAPAAFSASGQAAFTFTSDDPTATFTCSLDGDTPVTCASPYSRTLSDGNHSFSVTDAQFQADVQYAVDHNLLEN